MITLQGGTLGGVEAGFFVHASRGKFKFASSEWASSMSCGMGGLSNAYYIPRQRHNGIGYSIWLHKITVMHVRDNNEEGPGLQSACQWKFVKWASTLLQRPARRQRS